YAYIPLWADHIEGAPQASPLARWQAEAGNIATNLAHEVTQLDDLCRQVLMLCNGQRDCAQLQAEMMSMISKGAIIVPPDDQNTGPEQLLQDTLRRLLGACLLLRTE